MNYVKALTLLVMMSAAALWAQTRAMVLDDSLSQVETPALEMQWRPHTQDAIDAGIEAWVRVRVHIDTRPLVGQRGRVYLVLPVDQPPAVEAVWSSSGVLLPGRVVSGERGLAYSGLISASSLRDVITVRLRTSSEWFSTSRRLRFHYEFEPD